MITEHLKKQNCIKKFYVILDYSILTVFLMLVYRTKKKFHTISQTNEVIDSSTNFELIYTTDH